MGWGEGLRWSEDGLAQFKVDETKTDSFQKGTYKFCYQKEEDTEQARAA